MIDSEDLTPALGDDHLPALFQSANHSSLEGQSRFLKATQLRLFMLVIAGGSGAVAVGGESYERVGAAAAVAFGIALIAELFILISRPEQIWYEARSAAESAKTLAWRYAVGGEPFNAGLDIESTDRLFLERLREILRDLRNLDLKPSLAAQEQISGSMRELRAASLEERKAAYNIGRIEDQRIWYAKSSARDETRGRWWMSAMVTMEVAGVALGLLRAARVIDFDLLGLAATLAAVMAAWMQAKQHQKQARAYFLAAQELAAIRSEIGFQDTEAKWASFVDEAEEAISREHTLWRASRGT